MDNAPLQRNDKRLRAIAGTEFFEDVADVNANRLFRDLTLIPDLDSTPGPICKKLQDCLFSHGKIVAGWSIFKTRYKCLRKIAPPAATVRRALESCWPSASFVR